MAEPVKEIAGQFVPTNRVPPSFVTKGGDGQRDTFEGGAVRDAQAGKSRYELIPPGPLKRIADLYARGAVKYDAHNWSKGMSTERILASLYRHLEQWRNGETDEDHMAAVGWNALAALYFEGTEWDDRHDWSVPKKPVPEVDGVPLPSGAKVLIKEPGQPDRVSILP